MRTLPLIFFVSATALADIPPLSSQPQDLLRRDDQPALVRAAPFEGGVYRACVCAAQAGQDNPCAHSLSSATAPKEAEPGRPRSYAPRLLHSHRL